MTSRLLLPLVGILCLAGTSHGLDNGLARTPPMGWLSWERFLCNIDCAKDPQNCIGEQLYKTMADIMATQGYRDAGYQFVNVDDCWMADERDFDGHLRPNATRFPHGIKALADYIHSRGLKFGIYQDSGLKTCAGYPGALCHYVNDARTYADWGVDMVKLDGCNLNPRLMDILYPAYTQALNRTGRPIVFSCSWPAYQVDLGMRPNYHSIARSCNLWRYYDDISDSWESVLSILDYYASVQDTLIRATGPGRWSDPDMLIIGNYGLSYDQSKAQMALWAILAAPLFMSVDLRTIRPEFKEILLNRQIIAVNQDPLGKMGRRIVSVNGIEVWARPVTPVTDEGFPSAAIVLFNRRHIGGPVRVTLQLTSIGLNYPHGYKVWDLYDPHASKVVFKPFDDIPATVNPSGVVMLRAEPVPAPRPPPQQQPSGTTAQGGGIEGVVVTKGGAGGGVGVKGGAGGVKGAVGGGELGITGGGGANGGGGGAGGPEMMGGGLRRWGWCRWSQRRWSRHGSRWCNWRRCRCRRGSWWWRRWWSRRWRFRFSFKHW
ncbi:alpha-N-acetylgalactosaminidase-like [Dermacentor silvarum]|uniref:alpha-N-acetylgalactosaminidase-like n=1 Tax=Dermacentor silvarum TaxID=543639 RepID=UPI00189B284A|nr:alpha-N-acetylgalactosaminidase-like [Dermacentor silvarum]